MSTQLDVIEDIQLAPIHKTLAFDIVFGIAGPLLCVVFDPVVFKAGMSGFGGPIAGSLKIFAYSAIFIQLLALAIWLTYRRQSAFLAGVLMCGQFIAMVIGVALIPISLFGTLFFGIGIFGFTPWATAYVFWKSSNDAWPEAQCDSDKWKYERIVFCGLVVAAAIPILTQVVLVGHIERAVQIVLSDNVEESQRAVGVLRRYRLLADLDSLVLAYGNENSDAKRARMADVYKEVTGGDIEHRLAIIED